MLPIYREKWRSIQISTESIKQEKVAAALKFADGYSVYACHERHLSQE
ncbi:hypothetical protein [Nostoc sp.]